jgi:hypothetical protein
MRTIIAGALALSLSACAADPAAPYGRYAACGRMAALRANLTGAANTTPASDAILAALGVRCVASYPSPPAILARY